MPSNVGGGPILAISIGTILSLRDGIVQIYQKMFFPTKMFYFIFWLYYYWGRGKIFSNNNFDCAMLKKKGIWGREAWKYGGERWGNGEWMDQKEGWGNCLLFIYYWGQFCSARILFLVDSRDCRWIFHSADIITNIHKMWLLGQSLV